MVVKLQWKLRSGSQGVNHTNIDLIHASNTHSFTVSSDIVLELLEVAINLILYTREIYPQAVFQRRKKYNIPVQDKCVQRRGVVGERRAARQSASHRVPLARHSPALLTYILAKYVRNGF
ncbi:Mitotic spindle assembly checkpoint protein MAD2B [Chionoecetes opilio]|uniref:Mitotic spindle assembly checkpoint protein MAD2B n=1 Tax=Chionoecetes opilio TaxID=41210 RepID=A0A8J4Y6J0_CHIOP|nr:Mitotic spindle assembly checkpoint protein MAD2B [Chionoecetes opilio]